MGAGYPAEDKSPGMLPILCVQSSRGKSTATRLRTNGVGLTHRATPRAVAALFDSRGTHGRPHIEMYVAQQCPARGSQTFALVARFRSPRFLLRRWSCLRRVVVRCRPPRWRGMRVSRVSRHHAGCPIGQIRRWGCVCVPQTIHPRSCPLS